MQSQTQTKSREIYFSCDGHRIFFANTRSAYPGTELEITPKSRRLVAKFSAPKLPIEFPISINCLEERRDSTCTLLHTFVIQFKYLIDFEANPTGIDQIDLYRELESLFHHFQCLIAKFLYQLDRYYRRNLQAFSFLQNCLKDE
ncbi:UNVERIFIED_CONTAM: hypothetical protein NCL1_27806 [Trichonephila clavipes]